MKASQQQQQSSFTPALKTVRGEYNRDGYEVWIAGDLVYTAGNHVHDSTQPALCKEGRLSLRTIRKFSLKTTREIAFEYRGRFAGVERVADQAGGDVV